MKITNTSAGPRGFYQGIALVMLDKGQTWEGDLSNEEAKAAEATGYFGFGDKVARDAADGEGEEDAIAAARREVGEKAKAYIDDLNIAHEERVTALTERAEKAEAEAAELRERLAALDADGDGKPGGSKPAEPPALTGKTKPQLLEIAEKESVTVEDGATNGQIIDAIEKKRAQG